MNSSKDNEYSDINRIVDNVYDVYNTTDLDETPADQFNVEFITIVCLVILCSSAVVNLNLAVAIWRANNKGDGVLSYMFQLCVLDAFAVFAVGLVELYAFHFHAWTLGPLPCRLYLGAEAFTGAVTAYTLLSLDLHALVIANVERARRHRRHREDILERPEESDSECTSQHSLVSARSSSDRNAISAECRQTPISSRMPTALVWLLSASLSVPALVLSGTSDEDAHGAATSCSMFLINGDDDLASALLILLLAVFRVIVPVTAMIAALVAIIVMLRSPLEGRERGRLVLAALLTSAYLLMSSHRSLLMVLHGVIPTYVSPGDGFLNVLLAEDYIVDTSPSLKLSIAHYLNSLLRPIFCYWISAEVRTALRNMCASRRPNEDKS